MRIKKALMVFLSVFIVLLSFPFSAFASNSNNITIVSNSAHISFDYRGTTTNNTFPLSYTTNDNFVYSSGHACFKANMVNLSSNDLKLTFNIYADGYSIHNPILTCLQPVNYNINGESFTEYVNLLTVIGSSKVSQNKYSITFTIPKSQIYLIDGNNINFVCEWNVGGYNGYSETILYKPTFDVVNDTASGFAGYFTDLKDNFISWFNNLGDTITSFSSSVGSWFEDLLDNISDWFADLTSNLRTWFNNLRSSITSFNTNVRGWFSDLGDNLSDWFASVGAWFSSLGDRISDFFSTLWDNITGAISERVDAFYEWWNSLWSLGDNFSEEYKAKWDNWLTVHFGFLYSAKDFIETDLIDIFDTIQNTDTLLIDIPTLHIPVVNKTILEGGYYYPFSTLENNEFFYTVIVGARLGISAILYIGLIFYARKVLMQIITDRGDID